MTTHAVQCDTTRHTSLALSGGRATLTLLDVLHDCLQHVPHRMSLFSTVLVATEPPAHTVLGAQMTALRLVHMVIMSKATSVKPMHCSLLTGTCNKCLDVGVISTAGSAEPARSDLSRVHSLLIIATAPALLTRSRRRGVMTDSFAGGPPTVPRYASKGERALLVGCRCSHH